MRSDSAPSSLPAPRSGSSRATDTGFSLLLETHRWGDGVNFAVFSRHAERIWLELFANAAVEGVPHRPAITTPPFLFKFSYLFQ